MGSKTQITEVNNERVIHIYKGVYLEESQKLNIKFDDLSNKVLEINLLVKPNDYVGLQLAGEIAALYNFRVENRAFNEDKVLGRENSMMIRKVKLPLRDPIITIIAMSITVKQRFSIILEMRK